MTSFSRIARSGMLCIGEGQRPRSAAGRALEERMRGIGSTLRQQLDAVRDEKWESQTARQTAAAKVIQFHHKRLDLVETELSRLEEQWHAQESRVANVVHQVEARVSPVRMRVLDRRAEQLVRLPAEEMQKILSAAVGSKDEDTLIAAVIAGKLGAREALEAYCVGPDAAREARDLAGDHLALRQAHDAMRLGLREMERDPASHLPANAHASPEEKLSVLSGGLSAIVTIQDHLARKAREQAVEQQQAAAPQPTIEQQALKAALPVVDTETKASA